MENTIEIIPGPGVLSDFQLLRKRAEAVAPFIDWIQIDIADGVLVPNKTPLDPAEYKQALSGIDAKFELHMMVEDPLSSIEKWIEAGFGRLLIHIESFKKANQQSIKSTIHHVKQKGIEVGLAVDKDTSIDSIASYLDDIDCVLVMTIKAGFSGQKFILEMLDKVTFIKDKKPDLPIEVDGGINFESARLAIDAGVARLAVTSAIYNSDNVEMTIEQLKHG